MDRDAVAPKTWIAIFGASLGAFMAVLNIQIVNASLADIQGSIGAGIDDGGWISTAYLVAEIVVIPLTGWLSQVFSVRRYLLVNAALFLLFSVACAFAHDLNQMIVLRAIQGFTGGVLIPMAFTLVITLLPKVEATDRTRTVRGVGDVCAGHRPHDRRLPHGELGLGIHLLRQPGARCGDDRDAVVLARPRADAARPVAQRRLARHRGNRHRSRCAADRARGGQQGRLVRLAVHRAVADHRGGRAGAVRVDRADDRETAAESASACAAQLRFRHRRQLHARHRAVRFRLRVAGVSDARARLQRGADRRGAGVDRTAAAAADSAGAEADETHRCARADCVRLRVVRRQQFHERGHVARLCSRSTAMAEHRARDRPGADVHAACRRWRPPASNPNRRAPPRRSST